MQVADFGLSKLSEYGSASLQTRLVGTFGYMPPEYVTICFLSFIHCCSKAVSLNEVFVNRYAQYGDVSPKIDVYAFGVVLYELISAKKAVVRTNEYVAESKGLVALVVFPSRSSSLISTIKPQK